MTTALRVPLHHLFRAEIKEARRLGYQPQVSFEDATIIVRLVPTTPASRAAAAASAPTDTSNPVIQSVCGEVPAAVSDKVDALRETFASALVLARDAG